MMQEEEVPDIVLNLPTNNSDPLTELDMTNNSSSMDAYMFQQFFNVCGYIWKKGDRGILKRWKKRWFRIAGDCILYSVSEKVYIQFLKIYPL